MKKKDSDSGRSSKEVHVVKAKARSTRMVPQRASFRHVNGIREGTVPSTIDEAHNC